MRKKAGPNVTLFSVSLDNLYNMYATSSAARVRLVANFLTSFSLAHQYDHAATVIRFAEHQRCDVSVLSRPDIKIKKPIEILNRQTIRITEVDGSAPLTIHLDHMVVSTTHRLSMADPKISDWFLITNNISTVLNATTSLPYDTFPSRYAPPMPERLVMNSLALSGMATWVVRDLATIQRHDHEEECAYFCKRVPTVYPTFVYMRTHHVVDIGVFPAIWNPVSALRFADALKNHSFVRFDLEKPFAKSWSLRPTVSSLSAIVRRPHLKGWDWNSFVIASSPVSKRLVTPTGAGLPAHINERIKQIAPFCDLDYREKYSSMYKVYKEACDA